MVDQAPVKNSFDYWQPQLKIVARLSSWIAIPVLIGVFLGKWLDKKYDTEPWLFLATVGLSFIISMIGLVKNAMSEFKKIESTNQSDSSNQSKDKQ